MVRPNEDNPVIVAFSKTIFVITSRRNIDNVAVIYPRTKKNKFSMVVNNNFFP